MAMSKLADGCGAAARTQQTICRQTERQKDGGDTEKRKGPEIPPTLLSYLMTGSKPISSTIAFLVKDFEPRISRPILPLSLGMEDIIDREHEDKVVLRFKTVDTKNAFVRSQPGGPRATVIATKASRWKRMR